jgi:hypothetical protein
MSNVLIGIIGVILFIGLALAGALFLGPRFQEATADSKASAHISQIKQIVDAAVMYKIQEGSSTSSLTTLVGAGYLKSTPSGAFSITQTGLTDDPDIVFLTIDENPENKTVCERIQRQSGQIASTAAFDSRRYNMQTVVQSGNVRKGRIGYGSQTKYAVFQTF